MLDFYKTLEEADGQKNRFELPAASLLQFVDGFQESKS